MFKLNEFSRRCFRAPSEVALQRRRVGRGGHPGQPDVRDGNAWEVGTPGERWGDFGDVQGPRGGVAATGHRVDSECLLPGESGVHQSMISAQVMSFVCPE